MWLLGKQNIELLKNKLIQDSKLFDWTRLVSPWLVCHSWTNASKIATIFFAKSRGSCTENQNKNTTGKGIGAPLPSPHDIYTTRLTPKLSPLWAMQATLLCGRRYRSLWSRMTRLTGSFVHQAVRLMNSLPSPPSAPSSRTTKLAGSRIPPLKDITELWPTELICTMQHAHTCCYYCYHY